jgi:hypothetical protein
MMRLNNSVALFGKCVIYVGETNMLRWTYESLYEP